TWQAHPERPGGGRKSIVWRYIGEAIAAKHNENGISVKPYRERHGGEAKVGQAHWGSHSEGVTAREPQRMPCKRNNRLMWRHVVKARLVCRATFRDSHRTIFQRSSKDCAGASPRVFRSARFSFRYWKDPRRVGKYVWLWFP